MSNTFAIYAIVFGASVLLFCWSCYKRFRLITLGKPENRFSHVGRRIWSMLFYAFAQRRVLSRPFGLNHVILFWSFLFLLVANTEFHIVVWLTFSTGCRRSAGSATEK